jgi:hypothetical protein
MSVRNRWVAGLLIGISACGAVSAAESIGPVCLAERGTAVFPVVVSPHATRTTRDNAAVLAAYLERMTSANFGIEEGDGSRGIVLGCQADFPGLPRRFAADPSDPERTEEYLLHTHPAGMLLVGASDLGAQHAMWDFLGRQGYRQYFPGPTWEIIPAVPTLAIAYDEVQKPSYIMRSVWLSGGTYPERAELYRDWCRKNRQVSGFHIAAGHSYEAFIQRHREVFAEHPEYYALVDGRRTGPKLNIANPDLRRLFVESKLTELRNRPHLASVSVDPSDGGGWDESAAGRAIGSPSDQAVTLANDVARAIGREFPGRYVGMYAYNRHAEPPSIMVEPNVFVLVATAFRGTRLSLREQLEGWRSRGAALGIRDYLSYAGANYDVPSRCIRLAGARRKVADLRNYHDWGVRVYSAESGDNWGINGLLYYSVSRTLWDVTDTEFIDGLFEEFLDDCFGPVAADIRPYYEALAPAGHPVLEPGLLHTLYGAVEKARARNPGPAVEARLDDLTIYVRYLELYRNYATASAAERLVAARNLFSFLFRSRLHPVNHGYAIIRDLAARDTILRDSWTEAEKRAFRGGSLVWETSASGDVPAAETAVGGRSDRDPAALADDDGAGTDRGRAPLVTREELRALSAAGAGRYPPLPFTPVSYSGELVPAAAILEADAAAEPGSIGGQVLHTLLIYTWAEQPGTAWRIRVRASHEPRGKPAEAIRPTLELWAAAEVEDRPVTVSTVDIPPGGTDELVVTSPHAGLHWVILSSARWQELGLDPERLWTLTSLADVPAPSQGASGTGSLYFYVPRGTTVIGGHMPGRGTLVDPHGRVARRFDQDGYVTIPVPAGMDGRLWKILDLRGGPFLLLTVPPYFATSPRSLLLPSEVVERDRDR